MKIYLLRFGVILLLIFLQLSFLDIIFPWFHAPLLLLTSVIAWTLIVGFPESLWMTLPLSLMFDSVTFGAVSGFSLYAIFLSYVTSFFSRRLLIERQGFSLILYAVFASGSASGYQLLAFFLARDRARAFFTAFPSLPFVLSPDILLFSLVLCVPLFVVTYAGLRRFENYIGSISQKQFHNVR